MKTVLFFAASGLLALLAGIFVMLSGSIISNVYEIIVGAFLVTAGLSSIGWSVIIRNRQL
jgi:hypothetical protein